MYGIARQCAKLLKLERVRKEGTECDKRQDLRRFWKTESIEAEVTLRASY